MVLSFTTVGGGGKRGDLLVCFGRGRASAPRPRAGGTHRVGKGGGKKKKRRGERVRAPYFPAPRPSPLEGLRDRNRVVGGFRRRGKKKGERKGRQLLCPFCVPDLRRKEEKRNGRGTMISFPVHSFDAPLSCSYPSFLGKKRERGGGKRCMAA